MTKLEELADVIAGHVGPPLKDLPLDWAERKALAREGHIYPNTQKEMIEAARAVLTALLPPNERMLAAVDDHDNDKYVARGRAIDAFTAMIQSIILEEEG